MSAQPDHNECERIEKLPITATHYEVLGIIPQSTKEEIKTKYHTLALLCHPDKNNDNYKKAAQRIIHAYEVLSDSQKRLIYDRELTSLSLVSSWTPPPPPQTASELTQEYHTDFGAVKSETDEHIKYLQELLRNASVHLQSNKSSIDDDILNFLNSIKDKMESDDYSNPDIYPLYRDLIETAITRLLHGSLTPNIKEWILLEIYRDITFHKRDIDFFSPEYSKIVLGDDFEDKFNDILIPSKPSRQMYLTRMKMKELRQYIEGYKKIKQLEKLVNGLNDKSNSEIRDAERAIITYRQEKFDLATPKEMIQIERLIKQAIDIIRLKKGGTSKILKLSKQTRQRSRNNSKKNIKKYKKNTKRSKRTRVVRSKRYSRKT